MDIKKEKNGSTLVIKLIGNLDSITSENLEKELNNIPNDVKELVFDFDELKYLTSAGIRVLVSIGAAMSEKGTVKIINAKKNEVVYDVLKVTNLLSALNVE